MLCHRSLLHEVRSHLVIEFVAKNYDSTFSQISDLVLQHSLSTLRRQFAGTLKVRWRRSAEREGQRTVYRQSLLELHNVSPIENRYSIGKQLGSDEPEQYALSFPISKSEIARKYEGEVPSDESLDEWLKVLSEGTDVVNELSDILPILKLESNAYSVNVRGIMDRVQLLDVQKLVHRRFDTISTTKMDENAVAAQDDNAASRIFGALIAMRKVGDKQLAEICMMRPATVKKVLYRMLSDQFVAMEYVARSADRDCIKSFFLWTIDWTALHKRVLQSMYDALSNLIVKRRTIRKQCRILLEQQDGQSTETEHNRKYSRLRAAADHLTAMIHKIDLQIALHRDF